MIFPLYAGLLMFIYAFLTILVIRTRFEKRVSLGDGGYDDLQRYIRAHGNFIETVPFALILLLALEMQGAHPVLIYILGTMLVLGRTLHPISMIKAPFSVGKCRLIGMILTVSMIIVSGILCVVYSVM